MKILKKIYAVLSLIAALYAMALLVSWIFFPIQETIKDIYESNLVNAILLVMFLTIFFINLLQKNVKEFKEQILKHN